MLRELDDDEIGLAGPARVIRTKKGSLIRHVTDDIVAGSARGDPERLERLRSLDLVAYMCVPMIAHDRTLGAMTLATSESGRHFSPEDVRVAQDLATRAAMATETAQSYQQMQSANRLKDEFLATLSHELRTPLNAVLGYARMLQSGAIAEEKVPQALEVIDRNAGALAQIVEDVLDVSRIVLGKARLQVEPTDIAVGRRRCDRDGDAGSGRERPSRQSLIGAWACYGVRRSQPSAAGRLESPVQRREVHTARRPHRYRNHGE